MTRVDSHSTTRALPALPLPSEAKRSTASGVDRRRSRPVQRRSRFRSWRADPLLQLLVEQPEDLLAGGARLGRALRILHLHLRHARSGVGDVDAVLRLVLRGRAPEGELLRPRFLLAPLDLRVRIDVAHEEQALGAIAVLDGEAGAVESEAHAPPGAIETVVHDERPGAVVLQHRVARLRRLRLLR